MTNSKTFEEVHKDCEEHLHKVAKALGEFIKHESELCEQGFERAATAKLGHYINEEFKNEWDIDCEYDKAGLEDKDYYIPVHIKGERVRLPDLYYRYVNPNASKYEIETKIARPDVVIHHRRKLDPNDNLLIVEVKIDSGPNWFDKGKLLAFTQGVETKRGVKLRYQYGLCLNIPILDKEAKQFKKEISALVFTNDFPPKKYTIEIDVENDGLEKPWRKPATK